MSAGQQADIQALVAATRSRLASIEKQRMPSTGDRFEYYLTEIVYGAILGVTVALWAVLGFVIWVPLLVRGTTLFAATVLYVSLIRDYERLALARQSVHFAVRFYARGFEHFFMFYRLRQEPESPVGLLEPLAVLTRRDLLIQGAWVASVWVVAVLTASNAATALLGS